MSRNTTPIKNDSTKILKENKHQGSPLKSIVKENQPVCSKSHSKFGIGTSQIANKAAIFELNPKTKDPALLSVSERKALFEKNRGNALVPKAPIVMPTPVKVETMMKTSRTKIMLDENVKPSSILEKQAERAKLNKDDKSSVVTPKSVEVKTEEKTPLKTGKYAAPRPPAKGNSEEHNFPTIVARHQESGIASKMASLLENKSTISQEQIESSIRHQRQKEMEMLFNRFQKNKVVNIKIIRTIFFF